jgi:hypothetical protein
MKQVDLQTVKTSLHTRTKSLKEMPADTKNDRHEEARIMKAEMRINQERVEAKIEATRLEFQTQLKGVEAGTERRRGTGTGAGAAKPPKLDGTSSALFRCQFETVAEHNFWMRQEKSTYLIAALQCRATDVLHGVPKGATYNETLESLEDRFGDQHLAAAYCSQQKLRNQGVGEFLQEFATAVEQLAHRTYPALPEDYIKEREKGRQGVRRRVRRPCHKEIQLLLGGEKTVNEALRQTLELQAVLLAPRPQKTSARALWGSRSPPTG